MNDTELQIAVAEEMGWKGCTDVNCSVRKAQHLHKDGEAWFFESYTLPRVRIPNFPASLDACLPLIERLREDGWTVEFRNGLDGTWECEVSRPATDDSPDEHCGIFRGEVRELYYEPADHPARALCLAFLKVRNKLT